MTQSYRRSGDEMPENRPYAYGDDQQGYGQQGYGHQTYGGHRAPRARRMPDSGSRRLRRCPRTPPSRGAGRGGRWR